jgi:hypothetical protein
MKNLNTDFLLDIWADLKAKRLAPVAIGLAVAVVAMPALMLKGEEAPTAGPLPIVSAPAGNSAEVELAEELADGGSKLDSYKAHNPFDGLVQPDDGGSTTDGTAIAPGDLEADKVDSGTPSLGSGSDDSGSGPPFGAGGPPGLGGSGGGLDTSGGSTPVVKRPPRGFTYQLDVKFGRPGREKRYRSLPRMTFLPSEDVPALLFMGVPDDAKSAIFFVHPTLSHAGEGECIPSKQNCNFIELKIGRDHFLSVDNYEFRIHLLGIKKVRVKNAGQDTRKANTRRSARSVGDEQLGKGASDDYDWSQIVDGVG